MVYDDATSLASGCSLLQIWAWEHISVTHPLGLRFKPVGALFVMMYNQVASQLMLGKLESYRQALDDMDAVVWRPYRLCDPWSEDAFEVPNLFMRRFLLGRTLLCDKEVHPSSGLLIV